MPRLTRLAILDDYQGVTLALGPWDRVAHLDITVFRDTLADPDALVARLASFDAILAMRERTPFPHRAHVLDGQEQRGSQRNGDQRDAEPRELADPQAFVHAGNAGGAVDGGDAEPASDSRARRS